MNRFLVLILPLLLFPALSYGEPFYKADRAPLKNFMKFVAEYDKADFNNTSYVSLHMGRSDDPKYRANICKVGKIFWDKHEKDLRGIIENWEQILSDPLPFCEPGQLKADMTNPDIAFCRQYSFMLSAVIEYLIADKRPEEALKLSALLFRFGQFMMSLDGNGYVLFAVILGGAISGNAITPNLGNALLSPNLCQDFLKKFEKHWNRMLNENPSVKKIFDSETAIAKETSLKEAWEKSSGETLSKFGILTSAEDLNKAWDSLNGSLETLIKEYLQLFEKTIKMPTYSRFNRAMARHLDKIDSIAKNPPSDMDRYAAYAHKLFRIAAPSYEAFPTYFKIVYPAKGISLLAKAAIYEKPKSAEELKKAIEKYLPADIFSNRQEKLKVKRKGSEILVYSLGFNGCDDEGYEPNDISVIRISYEK